MTTIAFDESGNTGQHLLDAVQPVFVLASVAITGEHVAEAEKLLEPSGASEWKYSKFKRKSKQLEKVLALLESTQSGPEVFKLYVIHKPFMVVTKFVDLIHEPIARVYGLDLYQQGAALATANLFTTVLPVYLGQPMYLGYLNAFTRCVREPSADALAEFERQTREVVDALAERAPELAPAFAPVLMACQQPSLWLNHLNASELDPLVPAYFMLVDAWGQQLGEQFVVLADESKTVAQEAPLLMKFADKNLVEKEIAGTGGSVRYPLLVDTITTATSERSRGIQLADLLAGAANHVFGTIAKREELSDILLRMRDSIFAKQLVVGGIWPSGDVTPESLNAQHLTGENAVDYSHRILTGDPTIRRSHKA